jgi:hypothetical protein
MTEKIKVSMAIQVVDLIDKVNINLIRENLNSHVKLISRGININDLGDWMLSINIVLRPTNGVGIYRRAYRYPSDKEFVISVSISIPDNTQVAYGLSQVKNSFYKEMEKDNFYILTLKFDDYNNLYDYILDSGKRAIDMAFVKGFVCGGKKIKFQ